MQIDTLAVVGVSKQFTHEKHTMGVLGDITYSFSRGTTYAITGASGSGKSTFLGVLSGIEEPTKGVLLVDGKPFNAFSSESRHRFFTYAVGCLFQKPHLIRELCVWENVAIPGVIGGLSWPEAENRARELLCMVNIADKADAKPASLSGGQQQRAALARALINNPSFMLADEPTGNLDAHNGNLIVELLLSLVKKNGMGLILCTHDQTIAQQMDLQLTLLEGSLHSFTAR